MVTEALAGTRGRGDTKEEDERLGEELMGSEKVSLWSWCCVWCLVFGVVVVGSAVIDGVLGSFLSLSCLSIVHQRYAHLPAETRCVCPPGHTRERHHG